MSLFRTNNLEKPTNWQFWNGNTWTEINHNTYQGNFNGKQQPYVFWSNEDRGNECSHLYATNVRKYKNKWITLGSEFCLNKDQNNNFIYEAVFSWTSSLSNPIELEKIKENGRSVKKIERNGNSLKSQYFYSFFDVNAITDNNYQTIGQTPLLVVTVNQDKYYHQFLTLINFD